MKPVHPTRYRSLNDCPIIPGPVVYWMSRDQRVKNNWAMLKAQEEAIAMNQPLVVVFNLLSSFLQANEHHFSFMIEGLHETQTLLESYRIPFVFFIGDPVDTIPRFLHTIKAGTIITDFSPLKISRTWKNAIAKRIPCRMIEVDAHNIIPTWITSTKQEIAAYTIRPKIHRLLSTYLHPFPPLQKQEISISLPKGESQAIPQKTRHGYTWIRAGEKEARKMMNQFLESGLSRYAEERNDPNKGSQSNLSPYLHFGHISSQEIVLTLLETKRLHIDDIIDPNRNGSATSSSEQAFIEELVVRKELAENFCFYNPNYDTVDGFPGWAKDSHERHRHDPRDYVYSLETFEEGTTHDPLWNAAQRQMVKTGKMHGYMRMYWAKKILEWTKTPEDAMRIAIYMNDHYSLDGRDPNGYTGIAWSIGGVHDRPWFERPIFGKIRYMSYNGCKQKFDVQSYIKQWT